MITVVQILPNRQARGIRRGASRGYLALLVAAGWFLIVALPARATTTNIVFRYDTQTMAGDSVTFSFGEDQRAASAAFRSFTSDGKDYLEVILSNMGADVLVPEEVLTAVFFDLESDPTLTPESAVLASGSIVLFDSQPAGGVVGGEWAYWQRDDELPPPRPDQGISSTGIDLVGPHDLFPGADLAEPLCPDGLQYGLTSINDDPYTGNSKVAWNAPTDNPDPLIKHSVVFTLSGLPSNFDVTEHLDNVDFWYGTSRTPTPPVSNEPPIPEPITILTISLGGAGLFGYIRRRRNVH